jgi:serine/threonine protein kinase
VFFVPHSGGRTVLTTRIEWSKRGDLPPGQSRQAPAMERIRKLKSGTVVESPATGKRFLIANRLGEGGYGCAYRVQRLDSWDRRIHNYCLKTTTDPESWHREAYFGELLNGCERAIRVYDSFPLFPATRRHRLLYCLVFEYAEHGTIRDHLASTEQGWPPARARREIMALLKLLDQLHGAGALHRDITPTNVFVCKNKKLKLGDFGLARTVLAGKMLAASAFTPYFVSKRMAEGERRHWLPSDDVFQMGQLLAMLLRGDAESVISVKDVSKLPCNADLQGIVAKAICARRNRFATALDMLRALQGHNYTDLQPLKSLEGKTVAFTGLLSIRRFDAEVLVRQAGASISDQVTSRVNVIIQGRRSHDYVTRHKGSKLLAAERLIRQGVPISIISEPEFFNLVWKNRTPSRPTRRVPFAAIHRA